jgi:dTDP-glucose 4,6-dehydratase
MKRVLVTGSCGFLGSHLVDFILRTTDWQVVGLDRTDAAGDCNRVMNLPSVRASHGRFMFTYRDLRAEIPFKSAWSESTLEAGPFDFLVHMAASSHVDRSLANPRMFLDDNVTGTFNLLEWVRSGNVLRHGGKFLYFSTDEVFGPAAPGQAFSEWDRFAANNVYASTKAAAECLTTAWANTFGLPIVISHGCNFYGEGQHSEKFVPLLIHRISRGHKILIHADHTKTVPSSRFYLHAENVCSAVMLLLEKGRCLDGSDREGKYNIIGDEEVSNLDLAGRIAALLDKPLDFELVDYVPGRPHHDMRYAMRGERLRELGWKPHVSLDEGLRRVVESERR